jgi:hypothetical protein
MNQSNKAIQVSRQVQPAQSQSSLPIRTNVHSGDFEQCLRDCGGRCRDLGLQGDALAICYNTCIYLCLGK